MSDQKEFFLLVSSRVKVQFSCVSFRVSRSKACPEQAGFSHILLPPSSPMIGTWGGKERERKAVSVLAMFQSECMSELELSEKRRFTAPPKFKDLCLSSTKCVFHTSCHPFITSFLHQSHGRRIQKKREDVLEEREKNSESLHCYMEG